MKKNLTMLLTIVLMLTTLCAGAQASADESAFVGVWYLNEMTANGTSFDPGTMGMEATLTINEDGTASMTSTGSEDVSGTWTLEDGTFVLVEDNPAEDSEVSRATLTDGVLLFDAGDGTLLAFGQERIAAESYVPAAVRTDTAQAELDGEWEATYMGMSGMVMPIELAGLDMHISIADGKVRMSSAAMGLEATEGAEGSFADGVLTMSEESADGTTVTVEVALLEDGFLSYTEPTSGASIYLEKVVEE